jgi:hypothetical protein
MRSYFQRRRKMKKRSIFLIVLVSVLSTVILVNPAWAGSAQHNRWKGVAIGIGAAILGSAIYHQYKNSSSYKTEPCPDAAYHRFPPAHHTRRGYWEIRKEWIPPAYKEVWNPGHYDRRGEWVEGHWIRIVDRPGYWTEKRVWVAGKSGRHRGW